MATKMLLALVLVVAPGSLGGIAVARPSSTAKCLAGKHRTAGAYALCRQRAERRGILTAKPTAGACGDKFAHGWAKLEKRAARAGVPCGIAGGGDAVRATLDACTGEVAGLLRGAGPDACPADLATCSAELDACRARPTGRPLQTGQTECWGQSGASLVVIPCAGTGQDGETHQGLARAYVDNGDGTITDLQTGLMWEKLSDDDGIHDRDHTHSWADAFTVKVATLNAQAFAGYADWRVPNVTELQSLVLYGGLYQAFPAAFNMECTPGCSVTTCSCSNIGRFWSSTTAHGQPGAAWLVVGGTGVDAKTETAGVRAVRTLVP